MKFRKFGQVVLASVVSLGLAIGITACGTSNTIDYLFVTASSSNNIAVFKVDSLSGALVPIAASPFPSGGRNPVAEVTSPDGKTLYVLNQDDNTLVEFGIGVDGKLYPQNTYNTPGGTPTALAISPTGKFLFVADTYQPANVSTRTGAGAVVVYPITNGALGTPVANGAQQFWPVCTSPAAINAVASGNTIYVVNKTSVGCTLNGKVDSANGSLSAFQVGSDGTLAPVAGSPFGAGVTPNAVASDPTSKFLYVTDGASNQLISYTIQSTGILIPQSGGPTKTDFLPDAVTVDPRGFYVYVANFTGETINTYSIDLGTGNPSAGASGSTGVGTGPTNIIVDPALGRYVYTSNFADNTLSGLQLNTSTGALIQTQSSIYKAPGQPTAVAAVTHGNHAIQHTQP